MDRITEVIDCEWLSGEDCVGIALVKNQEGRLQAYIGVAKREDPWSDAKRIADYGARLSFREAQGFFPRLEEQTYGFES